MTTRGDQANLITPVVIVMIAVVVALIMVAVVVISTTGRVTCKVKQSSCWKADELSNGNSTEVNFFL